MPVTHKSPRPEQPSSADGHVLELADLRFQYPQGPQALAGVSLQMAPGEKVALVGPNGAGKSTLMLHINGLLQGEGEIRVCGMPLTDDNLGVVRAKVGLVFQNPDDQLFSPTVYEDVAFGPLHLGQSEEEIHLRVTLALAQVGMEDYGQRLSYHLSTGEKKRVAIATVLAMQPELLVLDEPTSDLDPRARRQLINLLDELPISMLVATHDLLMVRDLLPRTVILDEGKVVADGPTSAILGDIALLEQHGLELP